MSDVIVFKQKGEIAPIKRGELSSFAKTLASASMTRRIQTNTNGTFKRIINGEQIGDAIRSEIDVIIVAALPKVSRIYYAAKYDPDAEATLPNCWSNLGDKPEEGAEDPQHANCAECPQNVAGSSDNGSRACRFQRRLAVLVSGDPSGEIYQLNIAAKSLFGKGVGNVHPFEGYVKYLIANGVSPDAVVTSVSYDPNADTMVLNFTPNRNVTDAEYAMVLEAQANPDSEMYTKITVAQADKVTKQPPSVAPTSAKAEAVVVPPPVVAEPVAEPVAEAATDDGIEEPTLRPTKAESGETEAVSDDLASIINAWGEK